MIAPVQSVRPPTCSTCRHWFTGNPGRCRKSLGGLLDVPRDTKVYAFDSCDDHERKEKEVQRAHS